MADSKKRMTFFLGSLCSGGSERVVSILSSQFAEIGWDVSIVYYFDLPVFYSINEKVKMICIEKETGSQNIIKNAFWLREYIKSNADVVVSFIAKFNILALAVSIGTQASIVVSDRSDPKLSETKIIQIIRDFMYLHADAVVSQSKYAKECLNKKLRGKTHVIYNPINAEIVKGKALETPKAKKIVSVGRLILLKNQKMLINAFANIIDDFPDYKLIIYGEGEYRSELESLIAALKLSDRVELPGNSNEVLNSMCDANVFVLTSDYEGMPNALLEAMCLGLPVISTKFSGAVDVIQPSENGLLIDVGNEKQLVDALRKILSSDKIQKEYGSKALKIADQLGIETIFQQWESVVSDAVRSKAGFRR